MRIAIITAGGAGMFCGSCMHDNAWARGLIELGFDVTLIPTYTPIRVDEPNASVGQVFLGGINVYLNSRYVWWRYVPRFLQRWVDQPALIHWATRRAVSNQAQELGDLTLSMLAGAQGPHRTAGAELARYISQELQPDVVIFSNALLSGVAPQIRETFRGLLLCTLQGDDVFLDGLPPSFRDQAISQIGINARAFDGFLTHTRFYRDYLANYLRLPVAKFHTLPLGIDLSGHTGVPHVRSNQPYTVGFFARIAPEKGLHHLIAAFPLLKAEIPEARLLVGGYLPPQNQRYLEEQLRCLEPFGDDVAYLGSPSDHQGKVDFYKQLDVLSVPTEFLEPKGLYVLEAWANGVPVVQPAHGAFPELLAFGGGGRLIPPRDPQHLAAALLELADPQVRLPLARSGHEHVRSVHAWTVTAQRTVNLLAELAQVHREGGISF